MQMMEPPIQNLKRLSDAVKERRKNFVVASVNDSVLRLAVNEEGIYDWHNHPNSDELFLVLEGELMVEFKGQPALTLRPGETLTVPAGMFHRTITRARTVNLCFELAKAETVFL